MPGLKVDSPEMRCRGQKFNAHASPAVSWFSQVHDAALLFFLCLRIHQYQHFAIVDFVAQIQQPTVSADHQRLADFAEFTAFVAASQGLQAHLVEDALAAALCAFGNLFHALIFALAPKPVNCPFGQVFPSGGPFFRINFRITCTRPFQALEYFGGKNV